MYKQTLYRKKIDWYQTKANTFKKSKMEVIRGKI